MGCHKCSTAGTVTTGRCRREQRSLSSRSSPKDLQRGGIGEFFHGVPQVFHCRNSDNRKMQEGTTFTIEPVLTEGAAEWMTWDDGWTVATRDGGRTAQFEHTLL